MPLKAFFRYPSLKGGVPHDSLLRIIKYWTPLEHYRFRKNIRFNTYTVEPSSSYTKCVYLIQVKIYIFYCVAYLY